MIGNQMLPWKSIRTAVDCLCWKNVPIVQDHWQHRAHMSRLLRMCSDYTHDTLPRLLKDSKHALCLDPRDRVFALLSLLSLPESECGIKPDYTKSVAEVYKDAMMRWSLHFQDLSLLQAAEMSNSLLGVPSWVPNWSSARITNQIPSRGFKLLIEDTPPFTFRDRALESLGVHIDTIDFVEKFELPTSSWHGRVREMQRVISKAEFQEHFSSHESFLSALSEVITVGEFGDSVIPLHPGKVKRQDAREIVRYYTKPGSSVDAITRSKEENALIGTMSDYCRNRSLFRTKQGHLGLGPKTTAAGDQLSILLNSPVPFVMRSQEANQFGIVGEAYCFGFMADEAFLGSFPTQIQPVTQHMKHHVTVYAADHETTVKCPMYRHQDSGLTYHEDPRLGPLPRGWTLKNNAEEPSRLDYVNDETGKETKWDRDPRFSVESIRKRGVELQTFTIV